MVYVRVSSYQICRKSPRPTAVNVGWWLILPSPSQWRNAMARINVIPAAEILRAVENDVMSKLLDKLIKSYYA